MDWLHVLFYQLFGRDFLVICLLFPRILKKESRKRNAWKPKTETSVFHPSVWSRVACKKISQMNRSLLKAARNIYIKKMNIRKYSRIWRNLVRGLSCPSLLTQISCNNTFVVIKRFIYNNLIFMEKKQFTHCKLFHSVLALMKCQGQ